MSLFQLSIVLLVSVVNCALFNTVGSIVTPGITKYQQHWSTKARDTVETLEEYSSNTVVLSYPLGNTTLVSLDILHPAAKSAISVKVVTWRKTPAGGLHPDTKPVPMQRVQAYSVDHPDHWGGMTVYVHNHATLVLTKNVTTGMYRKRAWNHYLIDLRTKSVQWINYHMSMTNVLPSSCKWQHVSKSTISMPALFTGQSVSNTEFMIGIDTFNMGPSDYPPWDTNGEKSFRLECSGPVYLRKSVGITNKPFFDMTFSPVHLIFPVSFTGVLNVKRITCTGRELLLPSPVTNKAGVQDLAIYDTLIFSGDVTGQGTGRAAEPTRGGGQQCIVSGIPALGNKGQGDSLPFTVTIPENATSGHVELSTQMLVICDTPLCKGGKGGKPCISSLNISYQLPPLTVKYLELQLAEELQPFFIPPTAPTTGTAPTTTSPSIAPTAVLQRIQQQGHFSTEAPTGAPSGGMGPSPMSPPTSPPSMAPPSTPPSPIVSPSVPTTPVAPSSIYPIHPTPGDDPTVTITPNGSIMMNLVPFIDTHGFHIPNEFPHPSTCMDPTVLMLDKTSSTNPTTITFGNQQQQWSLTPNTLFCPNGAAWLRYPGAEHQTYTITHDTSHWKDAVGTQTCRVTCLKEDTVDDTPTIAKFVLYLDFKGEVPYCKCTRSPSDYKAGTPTTTTTSSTAIDDTDEPVTNKIVMGALWDVKYATPNPAGSFLLGVVPSTTSGHDGVIQSTFPIYPKMAAQHSLAVNGTFSDNPQDWMNAKFSDTTRTVLISGAVQLTNPNGEGDMMSVKMEPTSIRNHNGVLSRLQLPPFYTNIEVKTNPALKTQITFSGHEEYKEPDPPFPQHALNVTYIGNWMHDTLKVEITHQLVTRTCEVKENAEATTLTTMCVVQADKPTHLFCHFSGEQLKQAATHLSQSIVAPLKAKQYNKYCYYNITVGNFKIGSYDVVTFRNVSENNPYLESFHITLDVAAPDDKANNTTPIIIGSTFAGIVLIIIVIFGAMYATRKKKGLPKAGESTKLVN